MLNSTTYTGRAIRLEADQIEAAGGRDRFHRGRSLEHSPALERLVAAAAARAREGDPDALRFLYLRFADSVYAYVCSIVRDEHDAEDVTQLVFAKLTTALARYEPRLVPFAAWILRVARNAAIDHLRVHRPVPYEVLPVRDTPDELESRERFTELRVALDALPPGQRDVIVLRFLVGLTPAEVAQCIGRSEDAVHGLAHRGRRQLRRELALAA
jgi:RNA polymerase sigma-70 factor (ECF subfamily)